MDGARVTSNKIVCVRAAHSDNATLTDSPIGYVEFSPIGVVSDAKQMREQQTQSSIIQTFSVTTQTKCALLKTNSTMYEHQTLSRDAAARQWNHPKLVAFFEKVMPMLEEALVENALWDLFRAD